MASKTHKATLLSGAGAAIAIVDLPTPTPGPDEVLIRPHALALNPVDSKMQAEGLEVPSFPIVLGFDTAGVVEAVGPNVSASFAPGDRVIGLSQGSFYGDPKQGAFQELVIAPANSVAKIPASTPFKDVVVLPVGFGTATLALFHLGGLALPAIPPNPPVKRNETILISGGSSSVGSNAIQLGVAAGYDVVATASPSNFAFVRDTLGARAVIDHRAPDVVDQLVKALDGRTLAATFDAISIKATFSTIFEVVGKVNGSKKVATTWVVDESQTLPSGVTTDMVLLPLQLPQNPKLSSTMFNEFLPAALREGKYKLLPPAEVVGSGLQAVSGAVDAIAKGVSGRKLVITL